MAVRHGYGKIAGADALVFAYDTGDTRNSYKGEPTVNLADTDSKRNWGTHGGATSTTEDAPEKGPGWKKLIITDINGSNYRLAKFPYLSQASGTTRTYSVEYDLGSLTGYFLFVDGTSGYPQTSVSGRGRYSTTIGPVSGTKSLSIFLGRSGTSNNINHVIYYRDYQVEEKNHATPFIAGTRSATQGLLDLAGNRSINLTNTSFDSNAQMSFDGTDDGINLGTNMLSLQNTSFSLEALINWDGGSTDTFFGYTYATAQRQNIHWRIYDTGQLRFDFYSDSINSGGGQIVAGEWVHLLVTYNYDTDTCICYKNGTLLMQGSSGPFTGVDASSTAYLGYWGGSGQYFGGEIPIFKAYNRALTAAEVKNNFNNYKSRFNL